MGPAALLLLGQAVTSGDTVVAIRDAKAAQVGFERTRRRHLPIILHNSGPCEERIGRFCYWYDESAPPPPHEPDAIARARDELLDRLGALSAAAPASGWIVGQRVRYLVEHGALDSARAVAESCQAESWWCAALTGFALHALRDFVAAESAYASALALMPEPVRCVWTDLEPLLESGSASDYSRLSCAARDSANAAIFWRARPRFGAPGNDLRTEHFARMTFVTALEGAVTPHGLRSGRDIGELIVRYGWEKSWSRRPGRFAGDEDAVVGYEAKPAYPFLSVSAVPGTVEWELDRRRPRARYAPSWATAVVPVARVTLSRFARGDTLLAVAAFDAARDMLFQGDTVSARFALAPEPDAMPRVVEGPAGHGRGTLVGRVRADSALASLEIMEGAGGTVAVERALLRRPAGSGATLSDLLFFEPQAVLPESPEQAARTALPATRLPRQEPVGLYWEVYGLSPEADSVTISVSVEEDGAGLITRLGRAIGLGSRPPPLGLGWQGGTETRYAIELDLGQLAPGRYRVRVTLEPAAGDAVTRERRVEIVDSR